MPAYDCGPFKMANLLAIRAAELEIFSEAPEVWLPRIKLLVIETHDRFRMRSEESVRRAVSGLFEELPMSGENLIFRRRNL
jgi:hypothetical protein